MKTPRVSEPQEPDNRRRRRPVGARPRRGAGGATTGFGNIMRDVRGGSGSGGLPAGSRHTPGIPASITPGMPGFDLARAQAVHLDAGGLAAREMGAAPTTVQLANDASFGVRDAVDALQQQDRSVAHQAQSSAHAHAPTPVARMTPAALLETVLDEATLLDIETSSKELHVELEPAHLGPLVVRLRRDGDGHLDVRFRARQGDAMRVLDSSSGLLRERLFEAGFAAVSIAVEQDADLVLGTRHG